MFLNGRFLNIISNFSSSKIIFDEFMHVMYELNGLNKNILLRA